MLDDVPAGKESFFHWIFPGKFMTADLRWNFITGSTISCLELHGNHWNIFKVGLHSHTCFFVLQLGKFCIQVSMHNLLILTSASGWWKSIDPDPPPKDEQMIILVDLAHICPIPNQAWSFPSDKLSTSNFYILELQEPTWSVICFIADSWLGFTPRTRMTQPKTQTPHVPRLQWWVSHHSTGMSLIPMRLHQEHDDAAWNQRGPFVSFILSFHFISFRFISLCFASLCFVSFGHSLTHSSVHSSVHALIHLSCCCRVIAIIPCDFHYIQSMANSDMIWGSTHSNYCVV